MNSQFSSQWLFGCRLQLACSLNVEDVTLTPRVEIFQGANKVSCLHDTRYKTFPCSGETSREKMKTSHLVS